MPSVLCVEDSPTQAERLCAILEAEGVEAEMASNAQAALEHFNSAVFDLVITDIVMPGLSGYELCRKIKASSKGKDIPVILLTTLNDQMDIIQGLECGADNFITKPYDPAHLIGRVRNILHNKRMRAVEGKLKSGVEIFFLGKKFTVTSNTEQILDLLISTFEDIVHTNRDLENSQLGLAAANAKIEEYARQLEGRARWSEAKYRKLTENASDAILILDKQGVVLECNRCSETLFGRPAEKLIARRIEELMDPAQAQRAAENQRELNTAGLVRWDDVRIPRPDGTASFADYSAAVVELDGEKVSLAILRDITGRKLAEEALHDKTQQLQSISEAMTAFLRNGNWQEASAVLLRNALSQTGSQYGFVGVVVEGAVLRVLAHEGLVWDDTINRKFYENALKTYKEDGFLDFTNMNTLFGRVITSGQPVVANDAPADPRGGGIPSGHPPLRHFLGVPIVKDSAVVGVIGVANRQGGYSGGEQRKIEILTQAAGVLFDSYRRLEHQKLLEAQLLQAQKMEAIGQLAGGVAHDFNNLLTVIVGYTELLLERLKNDEPMHREIDLIHKTGQRAAALTRQLLAFSRRQVLEPKVIDLNSVVTDLDKMLRRLIPENIDLLTALAPDLKPVKADPGQIEQVVMNLVVNARDAMPSGGKLTIETANVKLDENYTRSRVNVIPGSYAMLAVSDNGSGMDERVKTHLFEPFFTTKEYGKGTGLGLSTVYGIVKQSGGSIEVYSEKGKGSTFKVYLPRAEGAADTRLISALLPAVPKGHEILLLVEDEQSVRELIQELLEAEGYTVLCANNGPGAIAAVEKHPGHIHLLVSDVVMPEMGGPELVERLKIMRPDLKVLFMSGYTDHGIVQSGILKPGVQFIQKPFTPRALARKVREVLDADAARQGRVSEGEIAIRLS